jgi:hypothetical protein
MPSVEVTKKEEIQRADLEEDMASITARFNRDVRKLSEEKDHGLHRLRDRYDRELIECLIRHSCGRLSITVLTK